VSKKLLNVGTQSEHRRTRSNRNTEFEELRFEVKPRRKMNSDIVTLKLEEAVKLIPISTGEYDVYQFIQACDLAIESVKKKNVPILIKYKTTRLSDRALEAIKYNDTTKWKNIKKYLTHTFEAQHSASDLQIEINSIKMLQGEDVNTYKNRVEKLFYKLSDMSTANKDEKEARIIHDTIKEQTLVVYIKGLIGPIRTIVKARNPSTLEEAKQLARSEEIKYKSSYEFNQNPNKNRNFNNQNFRNNTNPNNNFARPNFNNSNNNNINQPQRPIKCYICNGSHFANQCTNKRNFTHNYSTT
jgi:hypothetical protein